MRLAYSTLACPNWTLEQAVQAAHTYGYEGIELRLIDGEVLQPSITTEQRERIKRVCADAALPIICVDTSVSIGQPDPSKREQQIRDGMAMLELAAFLESPIIRVFGAPPADADQDSVLTAAIETLQRLAERGQELGVTVALETHDAFSSSQTVARVLENVPGSGAGVLWDLLHPFRVGETAEQALANVGDRLVHVHIKDGQRPADGGPKWDLTLLGEGDVPTPAILHALHAAGYNGWLAVEWEKKWHPHLAEPEIALPQHAQLLRQWLAALS